MKASILPALRLCSSALVLGVTLSLTGKALAATCVPPADAPMIEARMAEWTNATRKAAGLTQLSNSDKLDKAAQFHACNMARRGFLAHDAPGGPSFKTRLNRQGYRISTAVENIGRSTELAAAAPLRMWKGSPKHLVNTLNPDIRQMGFGVAQAADGTAYYVFIGGAPR